MTAVTLSASDRFRPVNPPPPSPPPLAIPEYNPETHYLEVSEPYEVDGVLYGYRVVVRPPVPDWVGFGDALLQVPGVSAMLTQALSSEMTAPIALTLPASIIEASKGIYGTFNMIWEKAKQTGLVDEELSNSIKQVAEDYNIPSDFVGNL